MSCCGTDEDRVPPINISRLVCDFDDRGFVVEIVVRALCEFRVMITDISNALLAKDYDALKNASHSMKGASANMTCDKISAYCADMEDWTRISYKDLIKLSKKIEKEFNRLEKYLNTHGMFKGVNLRME